MNDLNIVCNNIAIMKSNKFYRMGNLLFKLGKRWRQDRQEILKNPQFDGSILKNYFLSCKNPINSNFDRELFYKIINDYNKYPIINNDKYLFLSIRSGDILLDEQANLLSDNCYAIKYKTNIYDHNRVLKSIESIVTKQDITKIVLVTCLHFGDNEIHNSWKYTKEIEDENKKLILKLLTAIKNKIHIPIDNITNIENDIENIDYHFCTLVYNKNVLSDLGSFAKLIHNMRSIIITNNTSIK